MINLFYGFRPQSLDANLSNSVWSHPMSYLEAFLVNKSCQKDMTHSVSYLSTGCGHTRSVNQSVTEKFD